MKRVLIAMCLMMAAVPGLHAQHLPIYAGNSEVSGLGAFNQGRAEISFRYGHYFADTVQLGFYAEFEDSSFYTRTALGALFIKSFDTPTYLIPYLGAGLGYGNLDRSGADAESGVELAVMLGLRYFLSNNVSINTEFHVGVGSSDSLLEDGDPESMSTGIRIGLAYAW